MKKTLLVFFLLIFGPMAISADAGKMPAANKEKTELTAAQQARLEEMQARVEEIKSMDFRAMSKNERKEIREELKEMNAEAKATGNGLYLSLGAIIIIILLLILIL